MDALSPRKLPTLNVYGKVRARRLAHLKIGNGQSGNCYLTKRHLYTCTAIVPMKLGVLAVVLLLLAGAIPAVAELLVLPTTKHASSSLGANTLLRENPRTAQYVYSASLLASIPEGTALTSMAFSVNLESPTYTWPANNRAWSNYNIQISKSLHPPGSLSKTFAQNIGPDVVTVRSGPC